jgi:hypothetical protein
MLPEDLFEGRHCSVFIYSIRAACKLSSNSNDERSRYLGYHWRPLQLEFDRLSFSGGLMSG